MDHRRFKRHAGNQPASITLCGEEEILIPGQIRNVSGEGMGIEVGQPVHSGTPLRIEVSNSVLLGKAVYCRSHGARFYIGVRLDEPLRTLVAMSKALEELHAPARLEQQGSSAV
ncbi:MAG TPA: PilZ domain-containing protein [Candidatus Acidoferrales bacterium]|nr:PilZ domain-containing protein [Candidatus Acidoferrales bacterium]